jgi:hypothetical protein
MFIELPFLTKTLDSFNGRNLSITPDIKRNGNFSCGRATRDNSDQTNYKYGKSAFDKTFNEGNDTFLTTQDYQNQMSTFDERIGKLEDLVWKLFNELSGKFEQTASSTQLQLEDVSDYLIIFSTIRCLRNRIFSTR